MFKELGSKTLITTDFGEPTFYKNGIVDRLFQGELTRDERSALSTQSILIEPYERWKWLSMVNRNRKRYATASDRLSYLIVIPTLRCNLSCSYCQVSRAPMNAKGYDLSDENVQRLERYIEAHGQSGMKIEFQGGECTLRLDLIERIIRYTERCFDSVKFVLCTNLLEFGAAEKELFSRDNVYISTSLDGDLDAMMRNRTDTENNAQRTLQNIEQALSLFGSDKVAALPTITEQQIDDPMSVIAPYLKLGFSGVFLRPVNYQGFARKSYADLAKSTQRWLKFYGTALERIGEINQSTYFEEFYLAMLLRSIFKPGETGYVDFRSPARYGSRYMVIDYDGTLYPTDEARMLSRTRHVDLSLGNLETEFDVEKSQELNQAGVHQIHHDCIHCTYKPFCGIDMVDELSRYGRVDYYKHESWFCSRQTFAFDFIFSKLANQDRKWQKIFGSWLTKNEPAVMSPEFFK
jgi:His-Xaa-Ser system radical SAM maturase HxsB